MTIVPIGRSSTPALPTQRGRLVGWWQRRREVRELNLASRYLSGQWAATVDGANLVHRTVTAAGIPHTSIPRLASIREGPPLVLIVEMLPGQVAADFQTQAHRLAEGMRVPMARVSFHRHGWIKIMLLIRDPLTHPMPLPHRPPGTPATAPVLLGADEYGRPVTIAFSERVHLIVQGRTGSGKSRLSYAILQQLAAGPDAIIAGSDPSSVLLRPFQGSRHATWQVLGGNPYQHVDLIEQLVAEMDTRLGAIPHRLDELPLTPAAPMVFVVLEEWLALLGLAAGDRKLRDRLTIAARRLAAEGGKVGIRVIMLPQRAEANELGGGLLRGQFAYRLTLPVDNVDAVRLLHPTVPIPQAEAHVTNGQPGVALYAAPGQDHGRLRTPWMPDYGAYWDAIKALTAPTGEAP